MFRRRNRQHAPAILLATSSPSFNRDSATGTKHSGAISRLLRRLLSVQIKIFIIFHQLSAKRAESMRVNNIRQLNISCRLLHSLSLLKVDESAERVDESEWRIRAGDQTGARVETFVDTYVLDFSLITAL